MNLKCTCILLILVALQYICIAQGVLVNETKTNTVTFTNAYTIHFILTSDLLYELDYNTINVTVDLSVTNDCENSFIINGNAYHDNVVLNLHDRKLKISANCRNETTLTYNAHIMYKYEASNTTVLFIIIFCLTLSFPTAYFIYTFVYKCKDKKSGCCRCRKCCNNEYNEFLENP